MSSLTQPFVFLLVRSLLNLVGALSSVWLSLVIDLNSRYGYVWLAWRWWLGLLRSDSGSASGNGTGKWVWSGKLKSVKTFAWLLIVFCWFLFFFGFFRIFLCFSKYFYLAVMVCNRFVVLFNMFSSFVFVIFLVLHLIWNYNISKICRLG